MKSIVVICTLFLASLAYAQGPPAPYSVSLNWNKSTSAGVTGQNIYRSAWTLPAGPCGGSTTVNSSPISPALTTFTDSSVVTGNAYCYFVTALGATGESGPSNIATNLQIPPAPPTNVAAAVN